jgi:hypothetical protein
MRVSSEIISSMGFETEVADDFVFPGGWGLRAYLWGGYYNWAAGDPEITSLNVRFYEDAGSVPGSVLAEYPGLEIHATFVGIDPIGPIYKYYITVNVSCLEQGRRYWISVQAGDHPFPPQWGRVEALNTIGYPAMIRSAYLGYPDWTAVEDIVGTGFDSSFEMEEVVGSGIACCLPDGSCVETNIVDCVDWRHGHWRPCAACSTADCEAAEACCFADGFCLMLTDWGCRDQGGEAQGAEAVCDPNPCVPVPIVPTGWGRIKSMFR